MSTLQQRLAKCVAEFVSEPPALAVEKAAKLPLFLRERFQLCSAPLWGRRVLFAVEDDAWEPGAPGEYEKMAAALHNQLGEPVVLVLAQLSSYARNRLVRLGIPFVVPGSQFFIGHPDAGWRSAVIYSLLITARRYGLDPAKWLEDVLRRIPTATTADLHELLPANWKPQAA